MMYRQGSPPPPEAQVRCLFCGTTSLVGMSTCPCGAGLPASVPEEDPDVPLRCPRCAAKALHADPLDPKRWAHHCDGCGGMFVGVHAWLDLLSSASTLEVAILDTTEAPELPPLRLFQFARCPSCDATMERATFAARSAVTVDVCNVHGIWFDAGELYRVVLWLSEGGPRLSAAQDPVLVDLERRLDAQSMTYAKGLLPACLRAAGALLRLRVQR